jgi:gamma-glutamyltranspeptidase/glutathione hydrolase
MALREVTAKWSRGAMNKVDKLYHAAIDFSLAEGVSMFIRYFVWVFLFSAWMSFSVVAEQTIAREDREPEATTGLTEKQAIVADQFMVATANKHATQAGFNILSKGGNTIDAAIAVQAMLTLVEPQSSGIGGGTFILYWDNNNKVLHTFDGRETAPQDVNADLFKVDGETLPWRDAVVGGRSVGVPGTLRALEMAHQEFGKLPWNSLFEDTINLAQQGFSVSPRMAKLLAMKLHPGLSTFPASKAYFEHQGQPLVEGHQLSNPALANSLSVIAKQGADAFYQGELAKKIVKTVQQASIRPGKLSLQDMAAYQAKKRQPVCGKYRRYKVCGMPPLSAGGVGVLQILGLLERFDLSDLKDSAAAAHLYTQASKLMYADVKSYVADSDFTHLPWQPLLNKGYLQGRSKLISADKDLGKARLGKPYQSYLIAPDDAMDLPSTSHISIVDKQGNAVSMTSSIEFAFGSGLFVEGFLLNNQLTDFSLSASINGYPVLNRVEANKRPKSSMSPTILFDEKGAPLLIVGSPGGSRIISYVAQTIVNVLDGGMNIQQAIDLPRITNRNDYTALEKGTAAEQWAAPLQQMGHDVKIIDLNSGIQGIQRYQGQWIGGADPRREGVVKGR